MEICRGSHLPGGQASDPGRHGPGLGRSLLPHEAGDPRKAELIRSTGPAMGRESAPGPKPRRRRAAFPGRRCPAGYRHRGRGPMERAANLLLRASHWSIARLFIKPDPAQEEPENPQIYGVLCKIGHLPERGGATVAAVRRKVSGRTLSRGPSPSRRTPSTTPSDAGSSFVTLVGFQLALPGGKPTRTPLRPREDGVRLRPGGIGPDPADGPGAGEDVH